MLPSSGISEKLGSLLGKSFFNFFFSKHPEVQSLDAFSTIFLKNTHFEQNWMLLHL